MSLNVSPPPLQDMIAGFVPQSWARFFTSIHKAFVSVLPSVSGDNGNASITLTAGSARTQRFNTVLTANRTVTLPTSDVFNGMKFRVAREAGATGAFNLTVGGIRVLGAASTWVDVEYDGSAWRVTGYGTL